jgi:hypothetical protein
MGPALDRKREEMKYSDAFELAKKCIDALAAVLHPTGDRVPPPDIESVVMCKQKTRRGNKNDLCNEDCPRKERK